MKIAQDTAVISERLIQKVLMTYALGQKQQQFALPNSTLIVPWEADLLTLTPKGRLHEYEIKTSLADFRADFKKVDKHTRLARSTTEGRERPFPNYFWYVTPGHLNLPVDELPDYAGWIQVAPARWDASRWVISSKRTAPLLHRNAMPPRQWPTIARLLSFQLRNAFARELNTTEEIT